MKNKFSLFVLFLIPIVSYVAVKMASLVLSFFPGFLSYAHYVLFYVKFYVLIAIGLYLLYWILTKKWGPKTLIMSVGVFVLVAILLDVLNFPILAIALAFITLSIFRSYLAKESFLGFLKDLFILFLGSCLLGFFIFQSPWLGITGFLISQILFESFCHKTKEKIINKDKFWKAYRIAEETLSR